MDSGLTNATVETSTASATPPAPAPTAAPTPTQMPNFDTGGSDSGGGSFMDMLKSLNLMEVGFGILGTATLFYMIYYYRYNLSVGKGFKLEMENKIDELEIKVSDLSSALQQQQRQQQQQVNNSNFGL